MSKCGPREKIDNGDNVLTTFKVYEELKGGVNKQMRDERNARRKRF